MVPRLYTSQPLSSSVVDLSKEQAHYLRNVLRRSVGDTVLLFNPDDGEYEATISTLDKKSAQVEVQKQTHPPKAEADLWLLFAPLKKTATDFVIEKGTELGVTKFYPVITVRTQTQKIRDDRLQANAIEAAEQTERLSIPKVQELTKLSTLLASWSADRTLFYGDESHASPPVVSGLENVTGPVAFLVGPEGGFSVDELQFLQELPFTQGVSLGPRILRADTAALSMLACYQSLKGDWISPI